MRLKAPDNTPDFSHLKVMAIGGGGASSSSAPAIREALSMTNAEVPSVLIIPTPKRTQEAYDKTIPQTEAFLRGMGLSALILHKFGEDLAPEEGREKIEAADFIYTSGGDTLHMMDYLRERNLGTLIARRALRGEVVLAGISAGAILPMQWGHSDSLSYRPETAETWDYIPVEGLGVVPTAITPHFNNVHERLGKRSDKFIEMIASMPDIQAFGIDNYAAMRVADGHITPFQSRPDHFVHSVEKDVNGIVSTHALTKNDSIPLSSLV